MLMIVPPSPSSPHAREHQIFPRFDASTIARLTPFGRVENVTAGTRLFERGSRGVDFFVVLDGAIELLDEMDGRTSRAFRTFGAGQFAGELHLFNERAILLSGRATEGTRILRIERQAFQRMVSAEPDIGETVMRAFILRRVELIASGLGGVTVVGSPHGPDTHRIRGFLSRNAHPYRMLDLDENSDDGPVPDEFAIIEADLPLVVLPNGETLSKPSNAELARALGIDEEAERDKVYDVAVVGAGPAGLAASVYAASEGLATIAIEGEAPGGQAGTSSRIENYLGFPTGISGQALAGRAQVQAQKFGTKLAIGRNVADLDCSVRPYVLTLDDGARVRARSVVIATGARYRRLDLPDYDRLEGCGIYYAATPMEAQLCSAREAIVIGGGNSAGQAAMFLSRICSHVHVLVRAKGLAATMSDYLVQRLTDSPTITVHAFSEVVRVEGGRYLQYVTWKNRVTGQNRRCAVAGLFVMIGADPNTAWLKDCVQLDDKGFVLTGRMTDETSAPSPYETALPGIFAVGDVRAGSVKRVASGVGEGSVVISAVHQVLQELDED